MAFSELLFVFQSTIFEMLLEEAEKLYNKLVKEVIEKIINEYAYLTRIGLYISLMAFRNLR
jgi:hypothetical protein